LQQLHFNQDFLQPFVIVAYRDTLACEFAQLNAIKNVLDKEHNAFPSSSKLPLFDEKRPEVIRAKSLR
jgi:hypothetical protein